MNRDPFGNLLSRFWLFDYPEHSLDPRDRIESRLEVGTHLPGILLIERLAESLQVKTSDLIVDRNIDL